MLSRRFRGWSAVCWYALAGCFASYAQVSSRPGASAGVAGVVAGIILDRESNAPIRRVVVTLSTVEAQPQDAIAWSDSAGRFAFGNLPPGRYQVRAQKRGYRNTPFGTDTPNRPPAIIVLAEGESRSDLVIRLQHFGAISGVVLDEDGEPVERAEVLALLPAFQRRERKLRSVSQARTDREGRYRIDNLPPGSYAVLARHSFQPVTKTQSEVTAGPALQPYVHGVQYYPGTDRGRSAGMLAIQGGSEVEGINLRLPSLPTVSLQIKVVPPGEVHADAVSVTALRDESLEGPNLVAPTMTSPDFKYQFANLTAGPYEIIAQASLEGRQYRGIQHVQLELGSPEVTLVLEPGVDLAGTVSVVGMGAAEHDASYVALISGDDRLGQTEPLRASVNRDGTFKVMNVPPGIWDIDVGPIPSGGYLKSMELGNQDVLTQDMVISSRTVETLKIVLSTQAAGVAGSVKGIAGPPRRAAVLLAPDGKFRHVVSFFRLTASDETGHFEIKRATPGAYKLFAFEEFNPNSIEDPEFLKPFEQLGVPVRLDEGQIPSQDVTLIPAGSGGK
jgi:hypothetical protein